MQSSISFVLDGKINTLDFQNSMELTPTTTVLNYLRSLQTHKGVKEGCAEGDCGACTVVVAELEDDNRIRYKAVDSCLIFLPMLHGKQLITVENLKKTNGELHPVQQAMVEMYGSQCGFCTPGIIMSMFELFKNYPNPKNTEIADVLIGNLCRCTGYRPIVNAAARAGVFNGADHFTTEESRTIEMIKSIPRESIHIHTDNQTYRQPASLGEAVALKHQHPNAVVLSGATDVALRLTKGHESLKEIIDLSGVEELKQINETDSALIIGAGVIINDVKSIVQDKFPALFNMLNVFASHQIRNVATLGGNLGTASPVGDALPVLMAYGSSVSLESLNGRREVSLDDYIVGYRKTIRKPDELITSIIIPKLTNGAIVRSYKISKRRDLDIATLSAGLRLELDTSTVNSVILAFGGMAEQTKRARRAEKFLRGKKWNRETVEKAMSLIDDDFVPISDVRGSAGYRRIAARNLLLRFWHDTVVNKVL